MKKIIPTLFLLLIIFGCVEEVGEQQLETPSEVEEKAEEEIIEIPALGARKTVYKCEDGNIVENPYDCLGVTIEAPVMKIEHIPKDAVDIVSILPTPDEVWNVLPIKIRDKLQSKSKLKFSFFYSHDKTFSVTYNYENSQTKLSIKALPSAEEAKALLVGKTTKCIPLTGPINLSNIMSGINCDKLGKDVYGDYAGAGLYRGSSSDPYKKILYFSMQNFYVEIIDYDNSDYTDIAFLKALAGITEKHLKNSGSFGKYKIYIRESFRKYLDSSIPYEIKQEISKELDEILDRISVLNAEIQIITTRPAYLTCYERNEIYAELDSLIKKLGKFSKPGNSVDNFSVKEKDYINRIKKKTAGQCRGY